MASKELCVYCFDVIISRLHNVPEPQLLFTEAQESPMFVTWEKQSRRGDYELRGCIGTLSPVPMERLSYYALSSAFKDQRFDPVSIQEVQHLRVAVSILTDHEECEHTEDWEVGIHGITIAFYDDNSNSFSATYLPEVAPAQGWNHGQTVESLVRKAGYRGRITSTLLASIRTTRYRSSKEKLSYSDYLVVKGGDAAQDRAQMEGGKQRWAGWWG